MKSARPTRSLRVLPSAPALLVVLSLAAACAGDPQSAEAGEVARTDLQTQDGSAVDSSVAASRPVDAAAAAGPVLQPTEVAPEWREADRMLEALGGREEWAELAAIELHGDTYLEFSEQPIPVSVWRDLENGRVRIEQTFEGTKTVFVIDEHRGWSLADGNFSEMKPNELATVRYEQARTPYRILRSLARREGVRPRLIDNGLEVYAEGEEGPFLCWIELGPDGRPSRYGYPSNTPGAERVVYFDHWSDTAGYMHPTHYSEASRGLRFQNRSFLPHTELNPELFTAPR